MSSVELLALAAALALTLVHLMAGKLRFLEGIPRSRWLSLAGGISVAYVFVHLLPELEEARAAFEEEAWLPALERHVWLIALARPRRLLRSRAPGPLVAPAAAGPDR